MSTSRDGSLLCTACGLCCQGMFHGHANVKDNEVIALQARGLVMLSGSRKPAFSLPCKLLESHGCSIYPERPQACRSYRCRLLDRYLAGQVDLEQGLAVVEKVKTLRDRLNGRNGDLPIDDPESCLDRAALVALVDNHFEPRLSPRRISPS